MLNPWPWKILKLKWKCLSVFFYHGKKLQEMVTVRTSYLAIYRTKIGQN